MRLVFFGTSHGVPEPNRHCSCAMVECGEHRYFVDMGMMAMAELVSRTATTSTGCCNLSTWPDGFSKRSTPLFSSRMNGEFRH